MQNTRKKLERARIHAGYSALHIAAEDGRHEDVLRLLGSSDGEDKDDVHGGGETALMLAAREGHTPVARALLDFGVAVDLKSYKCEKTALHFAAGFGHDEVVDLLVMKGADISVFVGDQGWNTALQVAAEGGRLRVVETLVRHGAFVRSTTIGSLRFGVEDGFDAAVKALLGGYTADSKKFEHEALNQAAEVGNLPVIKFLWQHGVNLDGTAPFLSKDALYNSEGATALHAAAFGGHLGVVTYLLDRGVRVDALDDSGNTPLSWSVVLNHPRVADTLLEAGADIGICNDDGFALESAVKHGSVEVALVLLRHKADVRGGTEGSSALHLATQFCPENFEAVTDLLLRWGADETLLDSEGKTPMAVLDDRNDVSDVETKGRVRQLLLDAPADRAWRRRGWLAMLRERRKGSFEGSKVPRKEGVESGGVEGDRVLGAVVTWLLAVMEDGVFRTTVGFL